ncbi:MAG: ABC transporter ATP-binding protein [Ferrovum sp.]|jgi:branched-chain amino acid transport system permease protein|nr:ABC transporter ATP-binding protein [Ferrovum sp.]
MMGNKKTGVMGLIGALCIPWVLWWLAGAGWVRILDFALLSVLLSMGLNIVVGFAGLLDLGYVAFFAVGAYTYALMGSTQFDWHWPLWVVLPSAGLLAALFGVLLGAPTLRLRGDYLAIVTLGFGEIIRIFLNNLNQPINITNGPQGIGNIDPISLGGFSLASPWLTPWGRVPAVLNYYYFFLLLACGSYWVAHRLEYSRLGRAWMAICQDETAAQSLGLPTHKLKLQAFAVGAFFGGVAGALFAGFQGFISPESFTLQESVMVLCMVVLGGMGNISGVVLGTFLLTLLPESLRWISEQQQHWFGVTWIPASQLRLLLLGSTLVLVMLRRPQGLWPKRKVV